MRMGMVWVKLDATGRATIFATGRNFRFKSVLSVEAQELGVVCSRSKADLPNPPRPWCALLLSKTEMRHKTARFLTVANNSAISVAFNVTFDTLRQSPQAGRQRGRIQPAAQLQTLERSRKAAVVIKPKNRAAVTTGSTILLNSNSRRCCK